MTWLMVAIGGAAGSVARYGVAYGFSRWLGNPIPYATAIVNILGCGIAGLLAGFIAANRIVLTPEHRALLIAGILGGFTTFSGFGLDCLALISDGRSTAALLNVLVQTAAGLVVLSLCYAFARNF
jgi:CrcB protein